MKLASNLAVLVLVVMLGLPLSLAGDQRPVVAVFDVQTKFIKLPKGKRDMLTELMAQEIGIGGVYQVMPPGDVKRILLEERAESYKECFDEKCQIELGRQLPANKIVTTSIMKVGSRCRVASSLYDLRRQTTDLVAKESTGCSESDLVTAVESVAAKIRAWQSGSARSADFVEEVIGEHPADWSPESGGEVIVSFYSKPEGAVVLVNANLVCQKTPCSRSVPKGRHLVSMQVEKHEKKQKRLDLAEGTKVDWKLTPNYGWLTVKSEPSGMTLMINGQFAGSTPMQKQEKAPGEYKILVTSACHYNARKKVRVEHGREQMVEIALKDKQGAVKVKARDEKGNDIVADVFVDGEKVGRTPGTYKVSICAAKMVVKSAKYKVATKGLTIREKQVTPVEVVLKGAEVRQPGTNLYWMRCPVGKSWTGSSCEGNAGRMNWHGAMRACPSGYRLPTRKEFMSLLGGCESGTCNKCAKSSKCSSMFGEETGFFWSSSSYEDDSRYVWCVGFDFGGVSRAPKGGDVGVRCVRGEP